MPLSPRTRIVLELTPLLASAAVLMSPFFGVVQLEILGWTSASLELLVPTVLVVGAIARRRPRDLLALWCVPCLLAPIATLYPWAVVPSPMGIGIAGLSFFLGFAQMHPLWRTEVLLGVGCVLGSGAMPVLFAMLVDYLRLRWSARLLLFLLSLVPWIPVLVRLDTELVLTGLAWAQVSMLSLFWAMGPLIRVLAVGGMGVGVMLGSPAVANPPGAVPRSA